MHQTDIRRLGRQAFISKEEVDARDEGDEGCLRLPKNLTGTIEHCANKWTMGISCPNADCHYIPIFYTH
jgi:hypothetical protein